jgi:hypothetical protein
MENPWVNLKMINNEYIAECDRKYIHNSKYKLKNDFELKLEGLPGPYTGNPQKALVYVLALNPGHVEGEEEIYRKYTELFLKNLIHSNVEWPFLTFCPELRYTPGGIWWTEKLQSIINTTSIETVSNYVFNAEYFPYHSKRYKNINEILPSQKYTFFLVKEAIKKNKVIIIMRSEKIWYKAIPELQNYKNKAVLKNKQRAWITSGNMDFNIYNKIIEELKNAVHR